MLSVILVGIAVGCASAPPDDMPAVIAEIHQELRREFPYRYRATIEQLDISGQVAGGVCLPYALRAVTLLEERGLIGRVVIDKDARPFHHATARTVIDGRVWVFDSDGQWPIAGPVLPRFDDVPVEW